MRGHNRLRRPGVRSLAGALALAVALAGTMSVLAGVLMYQLSADPYTNASSAHKTEVEPDSFAYGTTIVAAIQVGRFFDGGSSNIGWATSTDNGHHWTHGFLPGITIYQGGGPYQRDTDPAVAYDARHNVWLIVSLPLNDAGSLGQAVVVNRSVDGGLTWSNPVAVVTQHGLDKTWIACDNTASSPFYGRCYAEWDDNFAGNLVHMSASADGGLTWGPPRSSADSTSGLGGQPLVQPSGRVVVPYSENESGIGSFISSDGGATWSSSVHVADAIDHGVGGNLRSGPLPSAEIDGAGKVYVVWQDCRFRSGCASDDIVLSTSTDGLTWSAVTRIPIDSVNSTVDHFLPGIAVDKATSGAQAHLGLVYYYYPVANCTPATCQLEVGYAASPTAGGSWSAGINLAGPMQTAWLANTNQGRMVGDYMSASFAADGLVHPVYVVAHSPSNGVFDEGMYTPVLPLAVPSVQTTLIPAQTGPILVARAGRPAIGTRQ